ncbi:MAG: hypothetical protein LH614_13075 [Pyrinomonadaceae bacterium]|nr:hypothetical protein [Pyrinomonadaceae bacterium]
MREKNKTLVTPEGYRLTFRERESVEVKLNIPKDVLEHLQEIANKKDISVESVLKFFIGQGLRKESSVNFVKESALKRLKSRKVSSKAADVDLAA